MARPDSIKILGMTYTIDRVPFILRDEYMVGKIEHAEQRIKVLEGISEDRESIVILHEAIHGILSHYEFHTESNDETLVQCLATALYQCLRENPGLF